MIIKKSRIVIEFDGKAPDYENNRLSGWYIAQSKILIGHLGKHNVGDVLDIGCGTGWLIRNLARDFPDSRFVAIDISPKMIQEAKRSLPKTVTNVEFVVANWESIDPQSLSVYRFQFVVCTSALHYFSRPKEALDTIQGLMQKYGALYLVERDKLNSILTRVWDLLHRKVIKDHVRFYSAADLFEEEAERMRN